MVIYPCDWEVTTVDKVADINTGRRNTQDNKPNGRYKFFVRSPIVERIDVADYDCEAVLTAGDGNAGKVFHYVNGKFSAHQRVYIINNFRNISGRFFYYYFSRYFIDEVRKYTAKSTVDSVRRPMIANMLIPLPPLKEQTAIAETLATFDTHITNLTELITKKKAIRDGALDELMTGRTRLYGFCGDWEYRPLFSLCNELVRGPFGGSLKKEDFVMSGIKVYEQKNAIQYDYSIGTYFISPEKYNSMKRFTVSSGDFIVSCSGTIGRIYRLPIEAETGIINQALLRISVNEKIINPSFFNYVFKANLIQSIIIDNTQGGAMKNLIGMKQFKQIIFPVPPLDEQTAIADTLSALDKEISSLETERAKISQIRDGAINDLLTGKVRLKIGI